MKLSEIIAELCKRAGVDPYEVEPIGYYVAQFTPARPYTADDVALAQVRLAGGDEEGWPV